MKIAHTSFKEKLQNYIKKETLFARKVVLTGGLVISTRKNQVIIFNEQGAFIKKV